jgi:hypothetical protein
MSQPIDPSLAPAMAAADATVAALQGPPAPNPLDPPVVAFPGDPAAPAPVPGAPPVPLDAGQPPAPMGAPAAPAAPASPGLQAALASFSGPGLADAQPSAPPTGALPQPDGTVVKSATIAQPSTPGQAQAARGDLDTAQDAEKRATEQATREAARNAVIEAQQQFVAEQIARQKNEFETRAAVATKERVSKEMRAVSEGELDPGRVFTGGGGAWPIVQTLLGIAGGLVIGAIGGAPAGISMILGSINRAVGDDIARQREVKSSRLAYLTDVLGDENLAIQRLKVEQYNLINLTNASLAADARARKALSAAIPLQDALTAEHAREDVNFRKQHDTKVTTEVVGQQFLEMTRKPEAAAKPNLLNPETQEEFAVFQANGVDPNAPAYRKYIEERSQVAPGLGAVDDAERVVSKLASGEDVPGIGPIDETAQISRLMATDAGMKVVQPMREVVASFIKSKSGAAASDTERAFLQSIVEGRGTLADIKRGLYIVRAASERGLQAYDAGYPHFARAVQQIEGIRKGRAKAGAQQRQDAAFAASPLGAAAAAGAQPGDPFPDDMLGDSPERDQNAVDDMLTE